jgi:DNA-binding CsgD family transcriptional regulator
MSTICQECPSYQWCSSLCPEAEYFVSHDTEGHPLEIPQREMTIGLPKYGHFITMPSNSYFTNIEKRVVNLLGQGLTRRQISESLHISRGGLRVHLLNIRTKGEV